jgi:phosphoenolpyruvate carboxylase
LAAGANFKIAPFTAFTNFTLGVFLKSICTWAQRFNSTLTQGIYFLFQAVAEVLVAMTESKGELEGAQSRLQEARAVPQLTKLETEDLPMNKVRVIPIIAVNSCRTENRD